MSNNNTSTTMATTSSMADQVVNNMTDYVYVYVDVDNYTCSDVGLMFPAINEYTWAIGTRATLYLIGLFWCFLGVAILADIFMESIERITSKKRTVRIADATQEAGFREVELKVWNDTVANLSLLALGTSAPEILLSVIEIVGNNFKAGELGPGTIVGSAAFNLLFISAICIYSIPDGETRKVASFKVFGVTGFSCVFAYLWMAIVLLAISPGIVEIWEAVLTFLFFPTLIIVAYVADKDFFMGSKAKKSEDPEFVGIPMTGEMIPMRDLPPLREPSLSDDPYEFSNEPYDPTNTTFDSQSRRSVNNGEVITDETHQNPRFVAGVTFSDNVEDNSAGSDEMAKCESQESCATTAAHDDGELSRMAKELGREHHLPPEEAAKILSRKVLDEKPHGRGWYRVNAIRGMSGGKKLYPTVTDGFKDLYNRIQTPEEERTDSPQSIKTFDHSEGGKYAVVQFTAASVAVMENEGKVRIGIKRSGNINNAVSVRVETINGTAVSTDDYKSFNKVVEFKKKECLREIYIEIVDDCEWEPDEFFFVKMRPEPAGNCVIGPISINQVTIINDDEPGVLSFAKPSFVIKETGLKALIPIVRMNGADGHVSVKWKSKDITAKEGVDFSGKVGELLFDNQETTKNIMIPLFESNKEERDESFQLELTETTGGATIGKVGKTVVTIVNDEEFNGLVSRIMNMTKANLEALELQKTTYIQQFVQAMNVNGGEIESATFVDYILHFATFFWKVVFAFIPPAQYLGGWPAFIISLAVIGFLTAIIGDLASIFGCLIGLEDSITAITLVALGTSMPDLFASKTAALMEKTADSSVGNVNGSNSVNVFLGVGLPWIIASIYWKVKDGSDFEVPASSLGFSVILYSVAAVIALSILVIRRMVPFIGAELGGPKVPKIISSVIFITLWVLYILFSSLNAKGIINVKIGG